MKNGEMVFKSWEEVLANPNISKEKKDEILRKEEEKVIEEIAKEFEKEILNYYTDKADIKILECQGKHKTMREVISILGFGNIRMITVI